MRKVLTIAVAALMVVAFVGSANAAADSWRLLFKADNGAGASPAGGAQVGVFPTGVDGYSSGNNDDGTPYAAWPSDPGTAIHVAVSVAGSAELYGKNIQSPAVANPVKTWGTYYLAASISSTATVLRPYFNTVTAAYLPPLSADGKPLKYFMILKDNKGIAGAPVNGTKWEIPVPSTHNAAAPTFWYCPVNLPVVKLTDKSNANLMANGYQFSVTQEVPPVPEPSSMLALGSGLTGLVGFVIRRRRA